VTDVKFSKWINIAKAVMAKNDFRTIFFVKVLQARSKNGMLTVINTKEIFKSKS